MFNTLPSFQAHTYDRASDIPEEVWGALIENETTSNVVLPRAQKALKQGDDEQLWIAVFNATKNDERHVVFVLSCTSGPMGNYPIFIVACKPLDAAQLTDALSPLLDRLLDHVPPERIFSVFAPAPVASEFARLFGEHQRQQGIRAIEKAHYDASLLVCTRATFATSLDLSPNWPEPTIIELRRADMSHLDDVAQMCKGFSETSPPYVLNDARAKLEARTMIENNQVWVHMVKRDGRPPEVVALVAATRASDGVTAITKVFTRDEWRGKKCVPRLLRRVCQAIFDAEGEAKVVLYVGNNMASVRKMYQDLGFCDVDGPDGQPDGPWLEIGFEPTNLGYW